MVTKNAEFYAYSKSDKKCTNKKLFRKTWKKQFFDNFFVMHFFQFRHRNLESASFGTNINLIEKKRCSALFLEKY